MSRADSQRERAAARVASRWIPAGAIAVTAKGVEAVFYTGDKAGKLYAVGYYGSSARPAFMQWFHDAQERKEFIADRIAERKLAEAAIAEHKARRAIFIHSLKAGDVLKTAEVPPRFFRVVSVLGAMVKVVEIAAGAKAFRRRVVDGNRIAIDEGCFAAPLRRIFELIAA